MRLKELRKEKNLTQSELSKILNVATTTYNGYEIERYEPTIETLCKLADFYNVSLDYIIGREQSNDIGYLDELELNILKMSKLLNPQNKAQALAYISGLYVGQSN